MKKPFSELEKTERVMLVPTQLLSSGSEARRTVSLIVHDAIHVHRWDTDDGAIEFAFLDGFFQQAEDFLHHSNSIVFIAVHRRGERQPPACMQRCIGSTRNEDGDMVIDGALRYTGEKIVSRYGIGRHIGQVEGGDHWDAIHDISGEICFSKDGGRQQRSRSDKSLEMHNSSRFCFGEARSNSNNGMRSAELYIAMASRHYLATVDRGYGSRSMFVHCSPSNPTLTLSP